MAKKNAKYSDNSDTSLLLFDGRTGAVMAATSQEDLRQKVQAVREVVPSRSNNDILLVLQYYDSDVDRATQAFLEDGAKEALDNWHFSGNKPVKSKKKKNKNKSKDIPAAALADPALLLTTTQPVATAVTNNNATVVVETLSSPLATTTNSTTGVVAAPAPPKGPPDSQQHSISNGGSYSGGPATTQDVAAAIIVKGSKLDTSKLDTRDIVIKPQQQQTATSNTSGSTATAPGTINGSSTTYSSPYMNGISGTSRSGSKSNNQDRNHPEVPSNTESRSVLPTTATALPVVAVLGSGRTPEKIAVPNSLNCSTDYSLDNGLSSISSTASSPSTSLESSPINSNHHTHTPPHPTPNLVGIPQPAAYNHSTTTTAVGDSGGNSHTTTADNHVVKSNQTVDFHQGQPPAKKEPKRKGAAKGRSKSREKSLESDATAFNKSPPGVNSPALSRKKEIISANNNKKKPETATGGLPGSPSLTHKAGSGNNKAKSSGPGRKTDESKKNENSSSSSVSLDLGNIANVMTPRPFEGQPRERHISEASVSSTDLGGRGHKDHRGLEKSMKDLQRQVSSLQRHRNILNEDCEKAQKDIAKVFSDLKEMLIEREATMIFEMDQLKSQATDVLVSRQRQGSDLKMRTERAYKMSDLELQELRGDIKHFVSDRKIDEDIASQNKFQHDFEHISEVIKNFGEIQTLKHSYSTRRPSVSSVSSSMTDPLSPLTPVITPVTTPSSSQLQQQQPSLHQKSTFPIGTASSAGGAAMGSKNKAPTFHHVTAGAKVVSQSDSVTQFETSGEMEALLQNRKEQFHKSGSRRSQTPRGRSAGRGGQGRGQVASQRNSTLVQSSTHQEVTGKGGQQVQPLLLPPSSQQDDEDDDLNDTDTSSTSTSESRKSRNIRRRQKQRERQKERKHLSRSTSESSVTAASERGDGDGPQKTTTASVHQSEALTQPQNQSNASMKQPVSLQKVASSVVDDHHQSQASKDSARVVKKNQYNSNNAANNSNRSLSPNKGSRVFYPSSGGDSGGNSRSQSMSKGRNNYSNRSQSPTKRTAYHNSNNNYAGGDRSQSPMKQSQQSGYDGNDKSQHVDNNKPAATTENVAANASTTKDNVKFTEDTKKMDASGRGSVGGTTTNKNSPRRGGGRGGGSDYSPSGHGRGSSRGRGRGGQGGGGQGQGWRSRSKSSDQQHRMGPATKIDGAKMAGANNGGEEPGTQIAGAKTEVVNKEKRGDNKGIQNGVKKNTEKEENHVARNGSAENGLEHVSTNNMNNNNKGGEDGGGGGVDRVVVVEVGQMHSFNTEDHRYDEKTRSSNASNNTGMEEEWDKVVTSSSTTQIQEHIYDEALPQRKPRGGRISRKTAEAEEVAKITDTTSTVATTIVAVTATKEAKLNGEIMNGVSQEHRWSNEELDMIS